MFLEQDKVKINKHFKATPTDMDISSNKWYADTVQMV